MVLLWLSSQILVASFFRSHCLPWACRMGSNVSTFARLFFPQIIPSSSPILKFRFSIFSAFGRFPPLFLFQKLEFGDLEFVWNLVFGIWNFGIPFPPVFYWVARIGGRMRMDHTSSSQSRPSNAERTGKKHLCSPPIFPKSCQIVANPWKSPPIFEYLCESMNIFWYLYRLFLSEIHITI